MVAEQSNKNVCMELICTQKQNSVQYQTRHTISSTQQSDKQCTTPARQTRLITQLHQICCILSTRKSQNTTQPCSHPYVVAYVPATQQQQLNHTKRTSHETYQNGCLKTTLKYNCKELPPTLKCPHTKNNTLSTQQCHHITDPTPKETT